MTVLSVTHDVKWFKGVAEYDNVYVFWNKGKFRSITILLLFCVIMFFVILFLR